MFNITGLKLDLSMAAGHVACETDLAKRHDWGIAMQRTLNLHSARVRG